MAERRNGDAEQLEQWLREAGRRTPRISRGNGNGTDGDSAFNSPAALDRCLEELAGRSLHSRTELLAFLREVAGSRPYEHRAAGRRRVARELLLVGLLALSCLHYYYWDVQLQIASLNTVKVFLPAQGPVERKTQASGLRPAPIRA
jgi:hypothetical protein